MFRNKGLLNRKQCFHCGFIKMYDGFIEIITFGYYSSDLYDFYLSKYSNKFIENKIKQRK